MNIKTSEISPLIILAYLQFLEFSDFSSSAMANHISAIKTTLSLYGLPTQPFADPRIKCFQKAMVLHKLFKVHLKKVIDIPTLQLIVRLCDTTYMGQVFKAVYTLAFFSFLRLSNLVPHTQKLHSPLYQLARGDIIFAPPGLHILVKWSKTLQSRNVVKVLKIPSLGSNPICPVNAITNLLAITPGHSNSPSSNIKCPHNGYH